MKPTIRKDVLRACLKAGFQIAPDALDLVVRTDTPIEVINCILGTYTPARTSGVISREMVERVLTGGCESSTEGPSQSKQTEKDHQRTDEGEQRDPNGVEPEAKPVHNIEIIKNPTREAIATEGTVDDFHALFMDRFERLKRIYGKRIDTQGAMSLAAAKAFKREAYRLKTLSRNGERPRRPPSIRVVGMVKNRTISRSKNTIIELEDQESSLICVIPANRPGKEGQVLSERGTHVLLDEVVCVVGTVDQDGRLIAEDVIFPDVPAARKVGRAKRDIYAVFVSDIHCGSREFLEDEFDRFIDWLRGIDVDDEDKRMVSQIKYLFIAGDLCEGVGVYPGQEKDLLIASIHDQYELLAGKLSRLPDRIKTICIPGNHDASRQALPRPPIPEEFAEALYKLGDRILLLGDPSQVIVEGVSVLLSHGDSQDDLVTQIPGASYKRPAFAMKELLRKRHLAPMYGGKTELAPTRRDWLVIDEMPDIVHFGHAHHNAVDNYRGVQIINSGTFQAQTDFMRKQGVEPTPGIVTLVNLRTGAPTVRMFYEFG